jgi:hypothetical protein
MMVKYKLNLLLHTKKKNFINFHARVFKRTTMRNGIQNIKEFHIYVRNQNVTNGIQNPYD